MDAEKTLKKIFKRLNTDDFDITASLEKAMDETGFDFESDSKEIIDYISPEMDKISARIHEIQNEAKAILLESGVTETMLAWGRVESAKPTPKNRKRFEKLYKEQERQYDFYLGLYLVESIIMKRSDYKFTPHPMIYLKGTEELLSKAWKK